jgi:hypothetical protein
VGVGSGFEMAGGLPTGSRCVRLYVASEDAARDLPREIGGWPTQVVVSGRFVAAPTRRRGRAHRHRRRPARPGQSVGFYRAGAPMTGTLGALVVVGRLTHLLSNNHVLADCGNLAPGAPIFQPGLLDGGVQPGDRIATLAHAEPLPPAGDMDAALAEVDDARDVYPEILRPIGWLASPNSVPATATLSVEKVGRNGYTRGTVFDPKATIVVQYDGLGGLLFRDQVLIQGGARPFAWPGDSGSVVVSSVQKRAVALLFAASPVYALATPLDRVLARLGASLRIR